MPNPPSITLSDIHTHIGISVTIALQSLHRGVGPVALAAIMNDPKPLITALVELTAYAVREGIIDLDAALQSPHISQSLAATTARDLTAIQAAIEPRAQYTPSPSQQ